MMTYIGDVLRGGKTVLTGTQIVLKEERDSAGRPEYSGTIDVPATALLVEGDKCVLALRRRGRLEAVIASYGNDVASFLGSGGIQ
jgi:hypothetical protein